MKKRTLIGTTLLLLILAVILSGCNLAGLTITARVDAFVDDLNNDRAGAGENFHPDLTVAYAAIQNVTVVWDDNFPAGSPDYSLSGLIVAGDVATATISGPVGFEPPLPIEFEMAQNGGTDWRIVTLTLNGLVVVQ